MPSIQGKHRWICGWPGNCCPLVTALPQRDVLTMFSVGKDDLATLDQSP